MADSNIRRLVQFEYARLNGVVETESSPGFAGRVEFIVVADSPVTDVMKKSEEILKLIDEISIDGWPSLEEWKSSFPPWFLQKFERELTPEEANAALREWQLSRSDDSKITADELEYSWTFSNWIYWFEHENRSWFWSHEKIESQSRARLFVDFIEYPFAWGALDWLLKCCGATSLEEISIES